LIYAAERKVVEQAQLESKVPIFLTADEAIRGLAAARDYWRGRGRPRTESAGSTVGHSVITEITNHAARPAPVHLGYLESFRVLETTGITVEMPMQVSTAEEAVQWTRQRDGDAFALKTISEHLTHKSDAGGVRLGLRREDEVRAAFAELQRLHPGASIVIQRMIAGLELMVGSRRDAHFGPTVSIGPGGVFVELFNDVALRLAPITRDQAQEMLEQTRAGFLLKGFRGQPAGDVEAVIETLVRLSRLVTDYPAISELDINPLIVLPKGQGVAAVDARIYLG
jgi:acetyltransferase